jgi:hypothetical protein
MRHSADCSSLATLLLLHGFALRGTSSSGGTSAQDAPSASQMGSFWMLPLLLLLLLPWLESMPSNTSPFASSCR